MKKLLLASILFTAASSYGQYNAGMPFTGFSDINPDSLLTYILTPSSHEILQLNMFGDAANDIQITADGSSSPGGTSAAITVYSLNPDVYVRFGRYDSVFIPAYTYWDVTTVAEPLSAGDPIDPPGAVWSDTLLYLTDHSGYGGGNKNVNDWIGGDRYIGLKYQTPTALAYGWIRVNCISKDSCYVKDYSYTPALTGIAEKAGVPGLSAWPNPFNDHFYVNLTAADLATGALRLLDMYGREQKLSVEPAGNDMRIVPDPSLPAGCYTLLYTHKGKTTSGKVLKLH